MKKLLFISAILAAGNMVYAQNIATQKLEKTIITQENFKTPLQEVAKDVTIITSEDIQNKGATTVAEALKGVPGLTMSKADGSADYIFDLRGFGGTAGDNTLVLLNGIPLNSVQGSGADTSQIPTDIIDRIEIIPNGGNVMYGDGAVAGVINIITKQPQNKKIYGGVSLEASSFKTFNGNAYVGTSVNDKLLLNVAINGDRTNGYRKHFKGNDGKFDKTDKKHSVFLNTKYLLDNGSIEAGYRHSLTKDYYSGGINKTEYNKDPKASGSYGGLAKMKEDSYFGKFDTKITDNLEFMTYAGHDERTYGYRENTVFYKAKQNYVKPQIKYTYAPKSYIILGGDFKNGKSVDKLNTTNPNKTRKSKAIYAMNKVSLNNIEFTQGIRHEKIKYNYIAEEWVDTGIPGPYGWNIFKKVSTFGDKEFSKNSYELGANYLYSDTGSVYVSYNRGFRSPTIQDLNSWAGNLKLQTSNSYEIGIKDIIGNTYISSSIYRIDTDNEIYYDKAFNSKNQNFDGKVKRVGATIAMQHYFDNITLRENLTYTHAKIKSGKHAGHYFPQVPNLVANIGATYNFTDNFIANIDGYYSQKTYFANDFDNVMGKHNSKITWDTNVKYSFDNGIELYAGIRNMFNKKYCNAIFANPATKAANYNVADGRAYYGGFRYTF